MKNILLLFLTLILFSCGTDYSKTNYKFIEEDECGSSLYESKRYKLRQINSEFDKNTSSSATFFLIYGHYNSNTETEYSIDVFCETENGYKMIKLNPEMVYINIDNEIKSPELCIRYYANKYDKYKTVDYYIENYTRLKILIYTQEKYFPESINEFNLNK